MTVDAINDQTAVTQWSAQAAYAALVGIAVSGAALVMLHVLSPEFAPSWRMVSEYANGSNAWLLTIVFIAWALGSFALVAALRPLADTRLGKVGLAILILAGIGQTMGGLFDIKHPLHGPAAMIGIPSLCVAALVITIALRRRGDIAAPPMWSAHLPWIAFAAMIGAFILFLSSLQAAGVDVSAQSEPLRELPAGVSAYVGWANRFLFLASYAWAVLTALAVIRATR